MRNLFLLLLLSNLLFLAWRVWVVPPEAIATEMSVVGPEPGLRLHPGTGVTPGSSAATEVDPSPSGSPDRCLHIGPISDRSIAENIRNRLSDQGFAVTVSGEEGQIWVGFWVQAGNFSTRADAEKALGKLRQDGLSEAYIPQSVPPFVVSLGVYRERTRADSVAAAADVAGLDARVTDRYRPGTVFWLWARLTSGRSVSLEALGEELGQIVRADEKACPADVIGPAAPIQ